MTRHESVNYDKVLSADGHQWPYMTASVVPVVTLILLSVITINRLDIMSSLFDSLSLS